MDQENEFSFKNLFGPILFSERSAPINVNPSYNQFLFEGCNSPWNPPSPCMSSTSPIGTASSSSSASNEYGNKSSEDLSIDSIMTNLIQLVNCDKNSEFKIPYNDSVGHDYNTCSDIPCDACFQRPLFTDQGFTPSEWEARYQDYQSPDNEQFPHYPPLDYVRCEIHTDVKKFICHRCIKLYCTKCDADHELNHTPNLTEVLELLGAQSDEILDDLRNQINKMTKDLETIQLASENLDRNAHQATADVLICTQRATTALEAREKELLEGIETMRETKRSLLKRQDEKLRHSIKKLTCAIERITEAKHFSSLRKNPLELLLATDPYSSKMTKNKAEISRRQAFTLHEQHWISFSGSETNVIDAIANLGTIVASPPGPIGDGRALKGRGNSPQMRFLSPFQRSQLSLANPNPRGRPILGNSFPVITMSGRYSIAPTLKSSFIIGEEGDMSDGLCRPWGVTCDRDGHIIIADRSNNRIQIFKEDGTFVRRFGVHGTGPGQFDRPAGITVDIKRRIVVADKDNHRIQILTMEGVYLLSFGEKGSRAGQFNYPWDVATNTECQIVVSDTRNHRIQMFSSDGVFLRKYGFESSPSMWKHFDSPRGVCFNLNGDIVITDFNNHRLVVIDYDCLNARIVGFDSILGVKQFLRPQGLIIDDEGRMIVCDSRNHRIQVLDSNGNLRWKFGAYGKGPDEMDRPSGVALLPSGRIVAVDFGNNRVMVF